MAEKTKKRFIRYVLEHDKAGHPVDYKEVYATNDFEEFTQMQKEVEANQVYVERGKFEKVYSIHNLIVCLNYALPRGLISGEIRNEVLEKVDLIISVDNASQQADLIHTLLNTEGLEEFKTFFGKVAR